MGKNSIIIADDITFYLRNYFQASNADRIIGIADKNTWLKTEETFMDACKEASINGDVYIFDDPLDVLLPDEEALGKVVSLGCNSDVLFVALGSGTINDIVRYAANETGNKFISLPTAPSMDGYASSVSPIIRKGVKVTVPAVVADSIFIKPSILTSGPSVLVSAGIGDLAGKYCAVLDWKLSSAVTGEIYNPQLADMVAENRDKFFSEHNHDFFSEDSQIELLWNLIISGMAIAINNSSRPASGAEHHISHLLEMRALQGLGAHYLHGQTVGLGAWIILNIYQTVLPLSIQEIMDKYTVAEQRAGRLANAFGPLHEQFLSGWDSKKGSRRNIGFMLRENAEIWNDFRKSEEFPEGFLDRVHTYLVNAKIGIKLEDYGYEKEEILNVIVAAKEIRERFTILEFLDSIGCLEGVAAHIVERIF